MKNIAIQGHPTRGKEVIQILESLGGIDKCILKGNSIHSYYYINQYDNKTINCHDNKYVNEYCKKYTLKEFKKEFSFKIGDIVLLKGVNKPHEVIALEWYMNELCYKLDNGLHYAPETLTTYEKMKEERNITLTLDKAKEWYQKGGELREVALQAYSEEELTKKEFPKTWDEFCENYPVRKGECWLGGQDNILNCAIPDDDGIYRKYKNWIPSEKSAEAHLAMIQLEQLRDCWRQGWKPDWLNGNTPKYVIKGWRDKSSIETSYVTQAFLSFPTYKLALKFQECFRDLIEKAGDLV